MQRMRFFSLFITLFSSIVFFAATAENTDHKFKVGLIFPLSGGLADYGEALRRGFELAQEDLPKEFSHIELKYEDSQYDEKVALNAFNALVQKGGINLFHTWGVSPNASILPVANSKRLPVIAETSMLSAAANRPFVVRASRSGYAAAERLVEAFVKKGWQHVGIVVTQIPYYTDIADALVTLGKKQNIKVEIIGEVPPSEQEFRTALLKVKNKKFDAFGPLLLGDQLVSFCSQAKAINYSNAMFGAHIHNSIELMTKCMPFSDGVLFPGVVVAKEFRDRYMSRYHTDLRIDSAADSYETAKFIGELFGAPESYKLSAEAVVDKFKAVRKSESSVGPFEYTDKPESGKSISFHEIILTFKYGQIVPWQ
jgi:ABC-type branched-subunit amino acid transport system substrate-binding protein